MRKRVIAVILSVLFVIPYSQITVWAAADIHTESTNPISSQMVKMQSDPVNQDVIYQAQKNPASAGERLEAINSTGEYEATLRQVLTNYYKDEDSTSIMTFTNHLSDRANEICYTYRVAKQEREKTPENLGYVPGRVLISYNADVTTEKQLMESMELVDASCADTSKISDDCSMAVVDISLGDTVFTAIEKICQLDGVRYAQPDYIYSSEGTSSDYVDDSLTGQQYYLDVIKATDAWEYIDSIPYNKTLVAVIDTGIDYTHEDLQNAVNLEKSVYMDWDGTTRPLFDTENPDHGTHVSGIIAATGNNKKGIAGVGAGYRNDMIELMMVDCDFADGYFDTSILVQAVDYAAYHGARVINMSIGGPEKDYMLQEAIQSANDTGSLVVVAAGNNGRDVDSYPANLPCTISVISLNKEIKRSYFSNYSNSSSEVNKISAPGSSILSTVPGSKYEEYDGTSMATPVVTGVAAMIFAVNPALTPEEAKSILFNTTSDIYDKGYDFESGYGLVNAEEAVRKAYQTVSSNRVTSITIENTKEKITRGETLQLKAVVNSGAEDSPLIWSCSDSFIATVDSNGMVTAKENGVFTITVKSTNGKRTSVTMNCICSDAKTTLLAPTISETQNVYFTYDKNAKNLFWNEVDGADYYGVYRCSERDGNYELIGTSETTGYRDLQSSSEDGYDWYYDKVISYYKIRAFSKDVTTAASDYSTVCMGFKYAINASVLFTNTIDENSAEISWYGTGWCSLFRTEDEPSAEDRNWTKLKEYEPKNSWLTYEDDSVERGHTYYYRIDYYIKAEGKIYNYVECTYWEKEYKHPNGTSPDDSGIVPSFPIVNAQALQDDLVWVNPRLLLSWKDTYSTPYFLVAKSIDDGENWEYTLLVNGSYTEGSTQEEIFNYYAPISFGRKEIYKVAYATYNEEQMTYMHGGFSNEITVELPEQLPIPDFSVSYEGAKVKITFSPGTFTSDITEINYIEGYYKGTEYITRQTSTNLESVHNNTLYITPLTTEYRCKYSFMFRGRQPSLQSSDPNAILYTWYTSSEYSNYKSANGESTTIQSISVREKVVDGTPITTEDVSVITTSDGMKVYHWYRDHNGYCGEELDTAPKEVGNYWVGVQVLENLRYKAIKENRVRFTINEKEPWKVTFDENGGVDSITSRDVINEHEIGALPTAYRSGYQFLGWYTQKSGGREVTATTKFTSNATIYAQWKNLKPSIQSIQSVTQSNSSSVTITLKAIVANAGAYEIEYADNSRFTNAKTYMITTNSRLSATISGLTGGKHYYYRVKARSISKDSTDAYVYSDAVVYPQAVTMIINLDKVVVSKVVTQIYSGKSILPPIKLTYTGITLVKGRDYTVSYTNNKNIGTATIIITGIGKYTGIVKRTFKITVQQGKTYTVGNSKYKITNANTNGTGTVMLLGTTLSKNKLTGFTVASTVKIGGKSFRITAIGDNAFKGFTNLTKLTIGSNIKAIGKYAFYNCKKLKTCTIKTLNLSSVGRKAFHNISNKAIIKVPSSRKSRYKILLKNVSGIRVL